MNSLYLIVVIMAFVPSMHPLCMDDHTYPMVLNFAACLFLVNYIFHVWINCNKDFYLKDADTDKEDDKTLALIEKIKSLDKIESMEAMKQSWAERDTSVYMRRNMFKK